MKNFVSHQWRLKLAALFVLLALGLVHADITRAQSFEYRLGPGDKIQVKIFGRPDLSGIYMIRNSGSLSLPIAGEIKASDLTLNQLETEIENQYLVLMKSETGPDLGFDVNYVPTGGCCEGNNLAAAGLPNVDTLGVRGGMIHSADEFVKTDSFAERAKLSALILMAFADGQLDDVLKART